MTVKEAVLETFTGGMAKTKGFTNVSSISGAQNADGNYKSATILFTK